jgi:hypothetical protein
LNVSTITTGCFQMTKVLSVNDRAKVWEIKKVASKVIIIASPARAYLDKKCNRSRGRLSIG